MQRVFIPIVICRNWYIVITQFLLKVKVIDVLDACSASAYNNIPRMFKGGMKMASQPRTWTLLSCSISWVMPAVWRCAFFRWKRRPGHPLALSPHHNVVSHCDYCSTQRGQCCHPNESWITPNTVTPPSKRSRSMTFLKWQRSPRYRQTRLLPSEKWKKRNSPVTRTCLHCTWPPSFMGTCPCQPLVNVTRRGMAVRGRRSRNPAEIRT